MTWISRRERGSRALLVLTFWIVQRFGWHAGQALLYPIAGYYYFFSPATRRVSRDYLRRVLNRPVRRADVLRHIFVFACVLLDRVFLLGGRTESYRIDADNLEAVTAPLAAGRGCVLLGAHIGSFDMLRAFGRAAPVPVNPVMFRDEAGVFSRLVERIDPELARRVIDIDAPGAMLRVQEAVGRGEIVGFLADRAMGPDRTVALPFLGGTASFPTGPVVIAHLLRAPVVLFYGVRTGPRRYTAKFEAFAYSIDLRRSDRAEDVRAAMQVYADKLAAICVAHPFNWFNFYDFWQAPRDDA